ncbi:MAG TPA: DUF2087 domain-containing protein [Candidatus Ozemobacteraceae bacterium]|nr:DUF2087 domain-containing protein [Candidatus Ozemobacteraceae bacterium]
MHDLSDLFWKASLEEMKKGFTHQSASDEYLCLICGKSFAGGVIYRMSGTSCADTLYEARKAIERHIAEAHGSVFGFLLGLDKKLTGLTDHQKSLIELFHAGKTDAESARELGTRSTSTIRNHRFNLREKQKQAKVFLGIMELLEGKANEKSGFIEIPRAARQVDERFAITKQENDAILATYFKNGPHGPLSTLPIKEKRRIVILRHLITFFEADRQYTEKQVNEILKRFYHDYVMLRRNLIEYGFMDRTPDGASYWIKLS